MPGEEGQDRHITDGEAAQTEERTGGYDPSQVSPPKTPVQTAFLVVIHENGKAVATSDEMAETLASIEPNRTANIEDFRRASLEVVEDVRVMLQTQSIINTQMKMARQAQEQMQTQRVAEGLDLSKMKG